MRNHRLGRQFCVAYGVRYSVQANDPALLGRMLGHLPHGTEPDLAEDASAVAFTLNGEPAGGYSLAIDDAVIFHSPQLQPVLERLASELMVHVANFAPDRVFIHAGVVGGRGRALVMPGASFAGKTTLVAELVRAGATYYSDEYAVVDSSGRVYPHARDLQMRQPGRLEQTSLPVAALAGASGVEPLPVGRLVFTRYVAGAEWRPEPVSAGLAVLEMLRHSIPVQRTPARVMATLAAMMEPATAWRSERGDAAATARLLLDSMGV